MRISDWSSDVCSSDLATPALQCIFHCVARRRAGHDAGTGGDEPGVELVDQRTASLLSDSEALLGRIPSEFLLDGVDSGVALHCIMRYRNIAARIHTIAEQMCPAVRFLDASIEHGVLGELVVGSIGRTVGRDSHSRSRLK